MNLSTDQLSNFRSNFYQNLPYKPFCMDEKPGYMLIRTKEIAIKKPYIQINPPLMTVYFVFDDDKSDSALSWFDAGLPRPLWTTQNPENGHCHHCYKLEIPLCTSEYASIKAIKYAHAIYHAYAVGMGADLSYSHLITKNPLNDQWRTIFWTDKAYSLDYLADFVDLPKKLPKKLEVVGLGRNVTMFEKGRYWAYSAIRDYQHHTSSHEWERAVRAQLEAINSEFEQSLPYSEVKATAKSIAKWVWRNHNSAEFQQAFSEKQAKRGKKGALVANANGANQKGGKARSKQYYDMRQEALKMQIIGKSIKEISTLLNVHRNTVSNWLKDHQKSN